MRQFVLLSISLILLIAGCRGGDATPTPALDPFTLARDSAAKIRAAETFRLTITQTGPDYEFLTVQGAVIFRRADGQYVAPQTIQAKASVRALGAITLDIDLFAHGAEQWYRAIFTGNQWVKAEFATGFDPAALIAEESGFNSALNSLLELRYVAQETLENGQTVHHLRGVTTGEGLNSLLVGLVQATGNVDVDVYIDTTTGYPARFIIKVFESADVGAPSFGAAPLSPEPNAPTAEASTEPFVWVLDLYDINAPAQLDAPEGAA